MHDDSIFDLFSLNWSYLEIEILLAFMGSSFSSIWKQYDLELEESFESFFNSPKDVLLSLLAFSPFCSLINCFIIIYK